MWTPTQWAVAFPILAAAMLVLDAVWLRAAATGMPWLVAIAAGVIAGLFAAIGWTLRPLLAAVGVLCAAAALVTIGAAEASNDVGIVTAVIALAVCAAWVVTYQVTYVDSLARPRPRDPEHFGETTATRHALIVYHPSPHGFLDKQLRSFAHALTQQGWQVDLTVAQPKNDVGADHHDLIVLAAPVFNFRPARALVEHVRRLDLKNKNTILVLSGFGMTEAAMRSVYTLVQRKGAHVVWSVEIWTERPNAERHGTNDVVEIMRRAAAAAGHAIVR